MIFVTDELRDAVRNGNPQRVTLSFENGIVLTNEDIDINGIQYNELMNSDDDITIGYAIMSELRFQLLNDDRKFENFDFSKRFGLTISVNLSGNRWNQIPIGVFKCIQPSKVLVDTIDVIAYDRMLDFEVDLHEFAMSLPDALTLSELFARACQWCRVPFNPWYGCNADSNIDIKPLKDADRYTMRDLMAWISEMAGGWCRINRAGRCELVNFVDCPKINYDAHDYMSQVSEEYFTERIEKLQVGSTDTDIGVIEPDTSDDLVTYHISGNPLFDTNGTEYLREQVKPIWNVLHSIDPYKPTSIECDYALDTQCGDIVSVTDVDGNTYRFPVFGVSITWTNHAFAEIFNSGNQFRDRSEQSNNQKLRVGIKLHEFEVSLEKFRSYVAETFYDGTKIASLIEQTNEQIRTQVQAVQENIDGAVESLTSEINQQKDSIKLEVKSELDGAYLGKNDNAVGVSNSAVTINKNGISLDSTGKITVSGSNLSIDGSGYIQTGNWKFDNNGYVYTNGTKSVRMTAGSGSTARFDTNGMNAQYGSNTNGTTMVIGGEIELRNAEDDTSVVVVNGGSYNGGWYDDACLLCGEAGGAWSYAAGNLGTTNSRWDVLWVDSAHVNSHVTGSSRDYKKDIVNIEGQGEVIDKLNPVSFRYKDGDDRLRHGLIYEDTVDIMPEICIDKKREDDELGIDYQDLICYMLAEIKDLRKRVKELEGDK